MSLVEIIAKSAQETKKIAANLARNLRKQPLFRQRRISLGPTKHAFIIALEGNLGSGKTNFIQGLAAALGIKESVLSPTFLILKQFPILFKGYTNFYHVDAYRLKSSKELLELGFEELLSNPENIIVIEWADKVGKILPKNVLNIKFVNLRKDKRKIVLDFPLDKGEPKGVL